MPVDLVRTTVFARVGRGTRCQRMATGNRAQDQVAERDLLGTYLAEIGRVPLLTAEQEVDLAKRIEAGLFAEHLLDTGDPEPRFGDAADEELERIAISGQR